MMLSPPSKKLRDAVLGELWEEIDALTSEQGSTYGIVKKVIERHRIKFPWLNRDLLNNYRKNAAREQLLPPLDVVTLNPSTQTSDLTDDLHLAASLNESCNGSVLSDNQSVNQETSSLGIIVRRNIGGRPIGSTNVNKAAKKKRKLEALNEAATMYSEAKENKISTKHGKLKQIIEKINGKYNLHGDEAIKEETVRTRCKPGRKLHASVVFICLTLVSNE
jgi:hypothetical protein